MEPGTIATPRTPNGPSFSVVVAAYNPGERILPTIRSALAQRYRPIEILVIGDGCGDATGEILKSNFGDAVRWENLDRNHGCQSYPNNAGISRSSGTHIAYLGHDDIWSPHHLERLAETIQRTNPEFAVSGAVFHPPPGSKYYAITGMFDDPSVAQREFFPPSSFAHRRDVIRKIGPWRNPHDISPPVDCEFLLRAVANGCSFVSTRCVTVHKFAAGQRYLSYRFPSSFEQQRMLDRLLRAGGDEEVLRGVKADLAEGGRVVTMPYIDYSKFAPGKIYRWARKQKGLESPALQDVKTALEIAPNASGGALDWYPLERHPVHGPVRWSGPNPNPIYFLPVRIDGAFHLRIHIVAFADAGLAGALRVEINDMPATVTSEGASDGSCLLTARPGFAGPVTDGLKVCFRMPYSKWLPDDPDRQRKGIALGVVRVVRER